MIPAEIQCVNDACKATISVDPADDRWSVRTEIVNGVECVVERHLSLVCPMCGRSETPIVRDQRTLEPELDDHGQMMRFFNLVVEPVDPPVPL